MTEKIECPECGGKGLPIVWGLPTPELMARAERERDVILGGCCVVLGVTHECTECGYRSEVEGWLDPDDAEDVWVVGDLDGQQVLAATDEPEDDTEVWLEYEPENRSALADFDEAHGEGVVGWLAEPEPYDPNAQGARLPRPVAFGVLGDRVLIAFEDHLATWTRTDGITALTVTPTQYMRFNGGYVETPDPEVAAEAVRAYKRNPPSFGQAPSGPAADASESGEPPRDDPQPFAGCYVVGEMGGHRIISRKAFPKPHDEVWLEFLPRRVATLAQFDQRYGQAVILEAEPEPYIPRIPWLIAASEAADILGCSIDELDDWRTTALPSAHRKFYGQADNEFREEELVAIAVGRWLRTTRTRNKNATDGFAARLAMSPPPDEAWCVVRAPRSQPKIVRGTATVDVTDRGVVPQVYDPTPVLEALRTRR